VYLSFKKRLINFRSHIIILCAVLAIRFSNSELQVVDTELRHHNRFTTFPATDLFESDELLNLSLEGDVKKLMRDRYDDAQRHPLTLSYKNSDSIGYAIRVEAKTRGNFRRKLGNCVYPPVMLYFIAGDSLNSSLFAGQQKLKLVMPCRSNEHIIKEWLAYRIYNLITPQSFRARLVKLRLKDSRKNEVDEIYAILLEDEDAMAKRNNSFSVTRQKLHPLRTDSLSFYKMAMFEYLIGNTDWSVQYMQNVKLIVKDTSGNDVPSVIPYDFDMSGWVDAPYAKPADELFLASVKTRRFRGYCVGDIELYRPVINQFLSVKSEIYTIVNSCTYLSTKTIRAQVEYLNSFYDILGDPLKLKRDLLYPCDKNGTGNVVIKGLQNKQE
jgi:hypothetical protein